MILKYKGININYTVSGKGSAVVLLHGFLEDLTMWKDTVAILEKTNKVICIDLLGHGKTGCIGYIHTMTDMAEAVKTVLNHLRLRKYKFIGHSMGGYVALAFAKSYPESIKSLCLMNSTFEADDAERKNLRTRANKMVQHNFDNMVRMSFANLFSTESKTNYKNEYEVALAIALKTPIQGYMAANEGMKLREDSSFFFKNASFKKLLLLGKKDPVLNCEKLSKITSNQQIEVIYFSEGHMSHIENKKELLKAIVYFIEKI